MIFREYLETDIIDNCNLRCQHCSHHSPFMDKGVYDLNQFENDVRKLSKVLHVEKFRILGGEPLLNPNLKKYLEIASKYNLADNIGVCTNGTLLDLVDEELLSGMDFLDISLYLSMGKPFLEKIWKNINRLLSIDKTKISVEEWRYFRTAETLVENKDEKLVRKIWNSCYVKDGAHAIYKGYYVRCTASQRKGQFLKKMRVAGAENLLVPGAGGLNLNIANLEEKLIKYINSDIPLEACKWCLGVSSKRIQHLQRDEQNQSRIRTQEELRNALDFSQSIATRSQLRTAKIKGQCYKF